MASVYVPLLLSAAAFLISVVSLFYFRSYLKRRTGQERILSELREEVDNILKSIDETTDRDISLIEEREKNLKSLLEEIEKRLKVYVREIEKHRIAEEAFAALSPGEKIVPSSGKGSAENSMASYSELGKKRYRGAGREPVPARETPPPQSAAGEARERLSPSEGENEEKEENADQAFPLPRFRIKPESAASGGELPQGENTPPLSIGEQVRELARAGFAAPVIASRLGISIAEAEFAAALLERRDNR